MSQSRSKKQRAEREAAAAAAPPVISRRAWLVRAAGMAGAGVVAGLFGERLWARHASDVAPGGPAAGAPVATVYASPSCGCCHGWMEAMKASGFTVEPQYLDDVTPYKTQFGVPQELWACHTARVGDYTIEGHVPPDLVMNLLADGNPIAGLAVPGMPTGVPGMEGTPPQRYKVMSFTGDGKTAVFAVR